MKRALVLNGGGSRGAYEIGAWQALDELGVKFQAVYGTSIGALNAALFAQGDLERARRLWEKVTVGQIMAVDAEADFSIDRMVSRKRDVIPFLLENAKYLRADIKPLEKLVAESLDEARIRVCGMELGVMTFRVPQLQPVPMTLDNMAPGSLADWVIASASCFPVFPERRIDGQIYIDGGYYDNLPIDMALQDGADEVIAVELRPEPVHPEYARLPWLKTIRPRHSLGGFLDFNSDLMRRSLRLGYQDAMKLYGRFEGFLYAFRRFDTLTADGAARRFMGRVTAFDAEFMRRGALYAGHPVNAPLLTAIESETDYAALSWKDVWLRGLELCAEVMGFRVDAVYDPESLLGRLRAYADAQVRSDRLDESTLHAAWKQGERQVFALLTRWLDDHDDFPQAVQRRLGELPRPTAAAIFMRSMKG